MWTRLCVLAATCLQASKGLIPVNCDLTGNAKVHSALDVGDLTGSMLLSSAGYNYYKCSSLCRSYTDCSHYSWKETLRKCDITDVPGSDRLTSCQSKSRPCGERPCKAGEVCVHVKAATSYICLSAEYPSTTQATTASTSTATTTTASTSTVTTTATSTTATTTNPTTSTTTSTTTTTAATTTTTIPVMTLGMVCSIDADCIVTQAECHQSTCRCVIGYQFSATKQTCSKNCAELGTDFVEYPGAGIQFHNDKVIDGLTTPECAQACLDDTVITCKTFEIVQPNLCRLSAVFWFDASPSDRLTFLNGISLHARQCV